MGTYKFRYFFDAGSGICLWSGNLATNEKYTYAVELNKLGLNENIIRKANYLMAWYDTSIDWDSSSKLSPWLEEERIRFDCESMVLYKCFCEALGSDFEIINESISSLSMEC